MAREQLLPHPSTLPQTPVLRRRGWRLAALVLAGSLLFAPSPVRAATVRVTGATRIDAHADRSHSAPDGVVIRGTLRDDVGAGVAESHVALSFFEEGSHNPPLTLPRPHRCPESLAPGSHEPHAAPDEYVVDTDLAGAFCLETTLPTDRLLMKLRFQGSAVLDSTSAEVHVDLTRRTVRLAFDPEPHVVSLDRPTFGVTLRVESGDLPKQGWSVLLRDETGRSLGTAQVDPDGLARIEVPTQDLGDPGPGELQATIQGTSIATPVAAHSIERHARVLLQLERPPTEGVPDDGIPISVGASSSRGKVPSGSVEATLGGHTIGAAAVRKGAASLTATFVGRAPVATAAFRYLPDTPWWEPGSPLTVDLPIRPPTLWRRGPAFLVALVVAGWMARRWYGRQSSRTPHRSSGPEEGSANVRPEVRLVRPRLPRDGWIGTVIDAHDGTPIVGARVSVVVPAFPGRAEHQAPRFEATTKADGHFVLETNVGIPEHALLRVEARWHSPYVQPLPAPSEVEVALIARRRALVERLVRWSAREWGPWQGSKEPTPEQIAARARRSAAFGPGANNARSTEVQIWARAVETVAFGPAAVDETAERDVLSLEPKSRA